MTYDPSTVAGMVRLTISDTDTSAEVFADAEIDAFLTMAGGDWRMASAFALDTIATNQALVLKVIKTLDLQTDGEATAAAIRAHAKQIRIDLATDTDGDNDFAIASFADPVFQWRETVEKTWLRRVDG